MNANLYQRAISLSVLAVVVGCSDPQSLTNQIQQQQSEPILIDGSSTVFPITDEVSQEFQDSYSDSVQISVNFSGTGAGFRKFCAGETDINDASRPIKPEEMDACRTAGIEYIELPIAFDALTVVVHRDNDWADSITLDELEKMWEPAAEGVINSWRQVRPTWPDQPLNLYGPGQDSGTFDYFTEVVMGEAQASRMDYTDSEDDLVLVQDVRQDPNALAYFGYAYYEENQATLKALELDHGERLISPSRDAVRKAQYQPFARPLFIYVNAESLEAQPKLQAFIEYYLSHARTLVKVVGYVPLPDEGYSLALEHLQNRKIGTVFNGKIQLDLTIEALLQKEAAF